MTDIHEIIGDNIRLPCLTGDHAEESATAILAAISAAGLVIVPREATEEMVDAVGRYPGWADWFDDDDARGVWSRMVAACPMQMNRKEEADGN